MNFLKSQWQNFKGWFASKWPIIKKEIKSLAQSFLAGVAIYLLGNWDTLKSVSLDKAMVIGVILAAVRSGVKVVWSVVEPQVLALLKQFSKKV